MLSTKKTLHASVNCNESSNTSVVLVHLSGTNYLWLWALFLTSRWCPGSCSCAVVVHSVYIGPKCSLKKGSICRKGVWQLALLNSTYWWKTASEWYQGATLIVQSGMVFIGPLPQKSGVSLGLICFISCQVKTKSADVGNRMLLAKNLIWEE